MFISLDLETTGFDPQTDKIIEFGAVKFDLNGEKERLSFLIDPGTKLPDIITHITKIKDEDLQGAPKITEVLPKIKEFIGDLPIIGHNIQFDTGFLIQNGIDLINPEIDTFELAGIIFPSLQSYSLEVLSHTLNLNHEEKHRALDDAIAAMELFLKLTKEFTHLKAPLLQEIQNLCQKCNWPYNEVLLNLKSSPQAQKAPKETPPLPTSPHTNTILEEESSSLFELNPPYTPLSIDIAQKADQKTVICVPAQIFKEIPNQTNKLDTANNYLSPSRLNHLKEQKALTQPELTTLIKIMIWQEQTPAPHHLRSIHLNHEERKIIPKINADPNFNTEAPTPKKDQALTITHQQLIKEPTASQKENLIILDLSQFAQSLFYEKSHQLSLDYFIEPLSLLPKTAITESLISKSTILFALLGLFYDKYNDRDAYSPRVYLKTAELQNKEWQDLLASFENLVELSHQLKEIINDKTLGYLKQWKERLNSLKAITSTETDEQYLKLIEKDFLDNITIKAHPISLAPLMQEILTPFKSYKIIDEVLDLSDNGDFSKNLYGIDIFTPIKDLTEKNESLEILISNDFEIPIQSLAELIKDLPGHSVFVFNSKQQIQIFTLKLSKLLKDEDIEIISQLTGSPNKMFDKFRQNSSRALLLLTQPSFRKFEDLHEISTVILHKIPFDPPSSNFISALSQQYRNAFEGLQVPLAASSLKRLIKRISKQNSQLIILDNRIQNKSYCKPMLELINTIATPKILNTASLLKMSSQLPNN
ncbi:hypothetical protein KJ632_03100 [Patescibacteria group bacterium]|nr:hypothetical protein [Patescibacteria group bacterium]